VRTLGRRLRLLEQHDRPPTVTVVRLFWAEEVAVCLEHSRCGIERSTGLHHAVVRLSWEVVA
jgi:hypothetical protein